MTKKKYPSARLERQAPFLDSLMNAHSHPRLRQQLLQHANKDQINAVSEVMLNTLKSNVPLDPPLMARLRRYKDLYVKWDALELPSLVEKTSCSNKKERGSGSG